eukprot:908787-Amphidinium_carterae.2
MAVTQGCELCEELSGEPLPAAARLCEGEALRLTRGKAPSDARLGQPYYVVIPEQLQEAHRGTQERLLTQATSSQLSDQR